MSNDVEELLCQINNYENALRIHENVTIENNLQKKPKFNYISLASIEHKGCINDILFDEDEIISHYLGEMNYICSYCGAKHFKSELNQLNKFSSCCHNGKILLPEDKMYPEILLNLFDDDNEESIFYRNNIREYNNAFAFASFGEPFDGSTVQSPFSGSLAGARALPSRG